MIARAGLNENQGYFAAFEIKRINSSFEDPWLWVRFIWKAPFFIRPIEPNIEGDGASPKKRRPFVKACAQTKGYY